MGNQKNILVSVVVPVYNVENYLRDCIESICAQSHKNLEIILVDDGSSDRSGEICDEAARKDPRIQVIHIPNGGVSCARNHGLDQADGEYICFADSDDVYAPFCVEHMLRACLQENADIAVADYKCFKNNIEFTQMQNFEVTRYSGAQAVSHLVGKEHVKYAIVSNKIYKAELLKKIRFAEGFIHEDEDFSYRVLYAAKNVAVLRETVYGYRTRPDSITTSHYSEKRTCILEIARKRAEFFKEKGENQLYAVFLWAYAFLLLQHYPKVKNDLHDPERAKGMKREFRAVAPELLSSPYLSGKRKCMVAAFCVFPGWYAGMMDRREKSIESDRNHNNIGK